MDAKKNVILISLIAALGGLLFGFDIAVFSGTIPFIKPYYNLSDAQLGWTGSSLYLGCIIGTLVTGFTTDKFGRKIPLIIAAAIFTVSSIFMGWAGSHDMLIFWRIVAGIGVGAASMLSPLYIAEISPASIRGKLVSINQLTIVIGILLAYFSNYLLADFENNWRWMFTSGAIPAFFFLVFVFLVPESPRWLISHGHTEKAKDVLSRVNVDGNISEEIARMEASISREVKGKFSDLFQPGVKFVVLLGVTLAVFQQISGANAVFFYAPIIFEKAGMSINDQLWQQILIGGTNLIFTIVAMQLVDRLGRKKLMVWGALLMSVWLLFVGLCFYWELFQGFLLTSFVMMFIATYATTLAPVTWVLISEIFPTRIRGVAVSFATSMLWVACFALAYGFPVLIERLNATQTFLFFSGICFVYFIILLKYVPETKGKTLEQFELEVFHH